MFSQDPSNGHASKEGVHSGAAANETGEAKKTLEEITLSVLDDLKASVRPARYVPNEEALAEVLEQLKSADPPSELDMEWFSVGDEQVWRASLLPLYSQYLESLRSSITKQSVRSHGFCCIAS
jgi:hypothetical protein